MNKHRGERSLGRLSICQSILSYTSSLASYSILKWLVQILSLDCEPLKGREWTAFTYSLPAPSSTHFKRNALKILEKIRSFRSDFSQYTVSLGHLFLISNNSYRILQKDPNTYLWIEWFKMTIAAKQRLDSCPYLSPSPSWHWTSWS